MAQSTTTSAPQSSAVWVEKALSSLLSALHISIPTIPGLPMGPGPVDQFSTIFNNTFTSDARGLVDGEPVDQSGLKDKLLALQSHYNPHTAKFHAKEAGDSCCQDGGDDGYDDDDSQDKAFVSFEWTTKDSIEFEVHTAAVVVKQGGVDKISFLSIKGKPTLFQKPGALSGEF